MGKNEFLFSQFNDYIDKSLFEEITDEILKDNRFKDVLRLGTYQFIQTNDGIASDADYDIYANVAMISWYYNRGKKRNIDDNNKDFIKQVVNRYFKQIKVENNLSSKENLECTTHIPNLCSMHCLCNSLCKDFDKYFQKNSDIATNEVKRFIYNSLSECIVMTKTILYAFDSGDYNSAASLSRTLIEIYCVFEAINYDYKTIHEYYKFMDYKKYHADNDDFHDDVKNGAKAVHCAKQVYEDYGWLKSLKEEPKYSFKGVLDYLCDDLHLDETYTYDAYRYYCLFAHGDLFIYKSMWDAFSDISVSLFQSLLRIATASISFLSANGINSDTTKDVYNNFVEVNQEFLREILK